jgi:hypothetical protein
MTNTPQAQPLKEPLLSAALSMSQFKDGLQISGQLASDDGITSITMTLKWPVLPLLNCPDNAGTWLYGVLAQLALHFDEHTVENAKSLPTELPEMYRHV